MNNYERSQLAALLAIDLRHWAEECARRGYLRAGVRKDLEAVADEVVVDAQMGVVHQFEPLHRPPEQTPR